MNSPNNYHKKSTEGLHSIVLFTTLPTLPNAVTILKPFVVITSIYRVGNVGMTPST